MRPTLTLKKKTAPASQDSVVAVEPALAPPVEPSAPVEPAKPAAKPTKSKPAKPSPKEARAAANRLLAEEFSARRRAGTERVKPLLDAYWAEQSIPHDIVLIDGVECLKPLAVGVHKTIFAWLRAQPQAEECTKTLLFDLIKALLGPHVAQPRYLAGLLHCPERFHLDGSVAGPVADPQKVRAQKAWNKLMAATAP